jgi:GTP-binding protein Era
VGKSTLINRVLGEKVAIVTPRPQTTRSRIYGFLNAPQGQMVFVDTPGFYTSTTPLNNALRRIAGTAASDSDVALVVVDVQGETPHLSEEDCAVLEAAQKTQGKVVLAINKIDLFDQKEALLPWIAHYTQRYSLAACVPVSARTGDGVLALLAVLWVLLPEGHPLFPQDVHTDQTERMLCAELVREHILYQISHEVPHSCMVVIEEFVDERREEGQGLCSVLGRIIVERDSQKAIVVGKGGHQIKEISSKSRLAMEKLLGSKVFLRLTVHVDPNWTHDAQSVKKYGIGQEDG